MRLILYTGKGGVGKSSIAAATAARAAALGRRTLLASADRAHNLSDILDAPVGGEPVNVAANLFALEVDTLAEISEHWAPADRYVSDVLAYLGMDDPVAEEVSLIPGLDQLFVLTRILREIENARYDTVIVDCPPTAGALRFLTFSDSVCSKVGRFIHWERRIIKLIRPFAKRIKSVRDIIPGDDAYGAFENLVRQAGRLGGLLKDPQASSVRLVLNPDRVAIAET